MYILRILHKIGNYIRRHLQRLLAAKTLGVRAVILDKINQQVLLVHHTYVKGWFLPGGGVEAEETPCQAIIREIREETGYEVHGEPELFGIYYHKVRDADDYPILFVIGQFRPGTAISSEIAKVKWFKLAELPEDIRPGAKRRIQEVLGLCEKRETW